MRVVWDAGQNKNQNSALSLFARMLQQLTITMMYIKKAAKAVVCILIRGIFLQCSPFSASEEHGTALSVHSTSPSQCMGLLHGTVPGSSLSDPYHAPHRPMIYNTPGVRRLGTKKDSFRVGPEGCDNEGEGLLSEHGFLEKKGEEKSKVIEEIEEECPTCLEGYESENPKIITKCGHHFHLGCILEWMERSNNCPVCDQEMVYSENP